MKEELIRVDNGSFLSEGAIYQFDIFLARGECIGLYVDEHDTSGTAYLDIFKGYASMQAGRAFCCGQRTDPVGLLHWIGQNCMIVDKNRFLSKELTAWDLVVALGRGPHGRMGRARLEQRLHAPETAEMLRAMQITFPLGRKLAALPLLDHYRLAVFRAWFWGCPLLVLDRMTEILRRHDLERLMECVQHLREQGIAVLLADMDERFLYRYVDRLDIVKDRKTYYRLYPAEFDDRLYTILGWRRKGSDLPQLTPSGQSDRVVVEVSDLTFPAMAPLSFQIRSGEIALLRDEDHNTVARLRDCFLGGQDWTAGTFCLDGRCYAPAALRKLIGTQIGIQLERPDRPGGVLFDNMTALDELSTCLLPKIGKQIIRKRMVQNILDEAATWFDRDALQQPLRTWSLPQRLRFSYVKWYFINPRLLICFFPFAGQESAHHPMIVDMLVACAHKGMAVWVIAAGADAISGQTDDRAFLQRLRALNG